MKRDQQDPNPSEGVASNVTEMRVKQDLMDLIINIYNLRDFSNFIITEMSDSTVSFTLLTPRGHPAPEFTLSFR